MLSLYYLKLSISKRMCTISHSILFGFTQQPNYFGFHKKKTDFWLQYLLNVMWTQTAEAKIARLRPAVPWSLLGKHLGDRQSASEGKQVLRRSKQTAEIL